MNDSNRRPLKVRSARFAVNIAGWLARKQVSPNQISIASVGFAALTSVCLILFGHVSKAWAWLPSIGAAVLIQCRLLCNLFDGMVAVEGGKQTPSGELFNDVPDRIADPMILIAAGYATGSGSGVILGWAAGVLAVMTAYVRVLGASAGAPMDFQGPMAKQHRMALMTMACVFSAIEGFLWTPGLIFYGVLLIIVMGSMATSYRRIRSAYTYLEKKGENA